MNCIGFIGAGRVGLGLSRALARAGERVGACWSRNPDSARALAAAVPGCTVLPLAQQVADACNLVFICVADDAIANVAASIGWRAGFSAVHCSGAAELSVLDAARSSGALIGGFHPLQMFADPDIAAEGLSRCSIAIEAAEPLAGELSRLALRLGARPLRMPAGSRGAYHAATHYAAAFLCVLLSEGEDILAQVGMDREASARALLSLARGALDAVEKSGPARAMAGAYARADIGTARKHLEALAALSPDGTAEVSILYSELARRSVSLALRAGRIDAAQAQALQAQIAAGGARDGK